MTELNPPSWLQDGCFTPQSDRLVTANFVCVEGVARGLNASANGLDRFVIIGEGGAFIEGDSVPGQGVYSVANVGNSTVQIAAGGAQPRIDLIVARIYDSQYAGTADEWRIEVVPGSPSAVPSPPAVPANAIPLYEVSVAAGASTISMSDLTDRREQYEFCPGGEYKPHSGYFSFSTGTLPQLGTSGVYGNTFTQSIPNWGRTNDELIWISELRVGTGYGFLSLANISDQPNGTINLAMRFIQVGNSAGQTVHVYWESVWIS